MKRKHGNMNNQSAGSGSSQKRKFSGSNSGSRPKKKPKRFSYKNQAKVTINTTTGPHNQAQTKLTAVQVLKKNIVAPDSSKQTKPGFIATSKTVNPPTRDLSNQGKSSSANNQNTASKPATSVNPPARKPMKQDFASHQVKKIDITKSTNHNKQDNSGITSNKRGVLPDRKTSFAVSSSLKAKVIAFSNSSPGAAKSEILESESGSDSSDSDDSDDNSSEDDPRPSQRPIEEAKNGSSFSESGSGHGEQDKSVNIFKVTYMLTKKVNTSETSHLDSNFSNDKDSQDSRAGIKSDLVLQPKIEDVESSSGESESGYDSDDEEEPPNSKANFESVVTPHTRNERMCSSKESGNIGAKIEEGEVEGIEDDWEDDETISDDSPVEQVYNGTATSAANRDPPILLSSSTPNSQPRSLLDAEPLICSSTTLGMAKSPQPPIFPKMQVSETTTPHSNNQSFSKSRIRPSATSNGPERLVDPFVVNENAANPQPAIPVWFSQKVRRILKSSNCPAAMQYKDINRLNHYRAWLEGVRYRRWQLFNLADEKRTQLTELLLKYKVEGRNMGAYRHRFLQRSMWKRDAMRAFKRLDKLMKGIKLLDDIIGRVFKQRREETMKRIAMQKRVEKWVSVYL